ncbi:hypothetical protein P7K49_034422 [Saguinus oedipus]|uniref:Uncharacterized protein n=1 Tax=Saguinus oedipus TaxID=9490 RepID=A0ABQ9TVI1_SAGOE|nr:hypothetical protein P7K49_034422 [Saguinus oedipus]
MCQADGHQKPEKLEEEQGDKRSTQGPKSNGSDKGSGKGERRRVTVAFEGQSCMASRGPTGGSEIEEYTYRPSKLDSKVLRAQDGAPVGRHRRLVLSGRWGPVLAVWLGSRPAVALCVGSAVLRDALVLPADALSGRESMAVFEGFTRINGEARALDVLAGMLQDGPLKVEVGKWRQGLTDSSSPGAHRREGGKALKRQVRTELHHAAEKKEPKTQSPKAFGYSKEGAGVWTGHLVVWMRWRTLRNFALGAPDFRLGTPGVEVRILEVAAGLLQATIGAAWPGEQKGLVWVWPLDCQGGATGRNHYGYGDPEFLTLPNLFNDTFHIMSSRRGNARGLASLSLLSPALCQTRSMQTYLQWIIKMDISPISPGLAPGRTTSSPKSLELQVFISANPATPADVAAGGDSRFHRLLPQPDG